MQFEIKQPAKVIKLSPNQRKALADQVSYNASQRISALRDSIPNRPSMAAFVAQAIMSNQLELLEPEVIKANIRKLASFGNNILSFDIDKVFIIPEEFKNMEAEYEAKVKEIKRAINQTIQERDQICLKIRVGSDEALQSLVKEIDEVGGRLSLTFAGAQNLLLGNSTDTESD